MANNTKYLSGVPIWTVGSDATVVLTLLAPSVYSPTVPFVLSMALVLLSGTPVRPDEVFPPLPWKTRENSGYWEMTLLWFSLLLIIRRIRWFQGRISLLA
ncbi:hypothetical protein V6N12_070245 [Hibiscus sabdariffa]|uniref:Uncharacterized protein n=1 Tax=Hibiscus sabdariffa TaxID=183260 RepID=A0ABR2FG81_9ROSI